ncbi:MAG: hypothetical protein ACK4OG_06525, partial [Parvibaculum sp.]
DLALGIACQRQNRHFGQEGPQYRRGLFYRGNTHFARARPQSRMEPRDLGTLRDGGDGIYVPEHSRRD